jgi:hypothetical protein
VIFSDSSTRSVSQPGRHARGINGYSLEYLIYIPGIEIRYRFPGELHTRFCTANLISVKDKVHQKDQKKIFDLSGTSWNLQTYVRPSS